MEIIPVSPQWYAGPLNHNFSLRDSFSNEGNDEYSTIRLLFTWQGEGKWVSVFPATLPRFSPKGWFGFTVTINLLCWTSDPVQMRTRAISNIKSRIHSVVQSCLLPDILKKKIAPSQGFLNLLLTTSRLLSVVYPARIHVHCYFAYELQIKHSISPALYPFYQTKLCCCTSFAHKAHSESLTAQIAPLENEEITTSEIEYSLFWNLWHVSNPF